MENLIVIIPMLYLLRSAKDKRLLFLIIGSCSLIQIVFMSNMDIALYYGVCAMISVFTALIALFKIKTTSSKVLAVFMMMQAGMCLLLILDWSFTSNELLQFKLSQFNVILVFILIALGIASNDKCGNNC